MRIYIIGFMGCGKTHWGRLLSQKINIPFFDLDEQIIAKEGKSVKELFEQNGEEHFRLVEKEVLYMISESHDTFVMACGGGTPCYFNNIEYIKKRGYSIWINCSIDCLFSRLVKQKDSRPLIKDLTDEGLRSYIIKKYADRKIYYRQASVSVNEEDLTIEKLAESLFQAEQNG